MSAEVEQGSIGLTTVSPPQGDGLASAHPVQFVQPTFWSGYGDGWWEWGGKTAPTIRELLDKLGPGFEVQDYFPAGRVVTADERGYNINAARAKSDARIRATLERERYEPKVLPPMPTRRDRQRGYQGHGGGAPQKYDRNLLLDLIAAGCTRRQVAGRVGCSTAQVGNILHDQRRKELSKPEDQRDPRAFVGFRRGRPFKQRGPITHADTADCTTACRPSCTGANPEPVLTPATAD